MDAWRTTKSDCVEKSGGRPTASGDCGVRERAAGTATRVATMVATSVNSTRGVMAETSHHTTRLAPNMRRRPQPVPTSSVHDYRGRGVRFRQRDTEAALSMAIMPIIPTSGTSLAVFGRLVRAARVALAVVATGFADGSSPLVRATPAVGAFGTAIDDEAIVPSCVVPVGVAAVGLLSPLTFVSGPVDDTLAKSDVFVCSAVVVCDWVVKTG